MWCGLVRFLKQIQAKNEEDFLKKIRVFMVTDMLAAIFQAVSFGIYGFWGSLFVSFWFAVDSLVSLYVHRSVRKSEFGLSLRFLDITTVSNAGCALMFIFVRTYMFIAIRGGYNKNILGVIWGLVITPPKVLKIPILYYFRRFSREHKRMATRTQSLLEGGTKDNNELYSSTDETPTMQFEPTEGSLSGI